MKSYETFFSKAEIEKIHDYTLNILENVGIQCRHEDALDIFKRHGAKIEGDRVFIDENLLNTVLGYAQKTFTIKSSKGDMHIGNGIQYNMTMPTSKYRYHENGKITQMTNEEVINLFKLGDTSQVIHTGTLNFFFEENQCYSPEEKTVGQMALLLKYSNKPVICSSTRYPFDLTQKEEKDFFRMSIELINKFEGTQGIHYLGEINVLPSLILDFDAINRILTLAKLEESILISPSAMPLMIEPLSMISMIALANAEILSVYTLIKLISPETPVVYGNILGSENIENPQNLMGSVESVLLGYGTAALAEHYSLPFRTGGHLYEAKDLDVQAGIESMMGINAAKHCKGDITLSHCGSMGRTNAVDFRKFLIDEEILEMVMRLYRGIDCKEEKFCYEMIKNAGPRGNFFKIKTPHIYNEEFYFSKYFDKDDPNRWQRKGSLAVKDKAQNEIAKRFSEYERPLITREQEMLLKPYLCTAYKDGF